MILVFMGRSSLLFAQTQIVGKISQATGEAIQFANILLLSATDSLLIKGEVSTVDGAFQFNSLPAGSYRIHITMLGFEDRDVPAFTLNGLAGTLDLGAFVLAPQAEQLEAVTVAAKKAMFEQKIDRLVVNVAGSITAAGTTALAVLERSPGVMVNRQNNSIALAGKNGVVVMMNGKVNRMPIDAVVQLLAGLPSSNIEKIEIITTPPANFDAEGNAGYINIVLKQSNDLGFNGAFTFSGGWGRGSIASAGTNFNYRKGRLNFFGDYAYSRQAQEFSSTQDREALVGGEVVRTETSIVRDPSIQRNHTARLGMDYEWSKKTVVGVLISGYDNWYNQESINRAVISKNQRPDTLINIANEEVNHWQNLGGNLNLQHTFSEKASLSLDVDYLHYNNDQPVDYLAEYFNGSGSFLFNRQTLSTKRTPINVGVAKVDYMREFSPKVKMEFGIKGTRARFDNDVAVFNVVNNVAAKLKDFTAEYRLLESIGAAYTAFDIKLNDQTELKLGLRYEYTNSNLGTAEVADIVDRQYGRFFPSIYLARTFSEDHSASFSFSRRVTRPTFNDLAPFVFFLDPYTFLSGNSALQPSFANGWKVDYRIKSILFSLQYTVEDSSIAIFQPRLLEGTNRLVLAAQNMKNLKTASFTLVFPWEPTKWWKIQHNFIGIWQEANNYYNDMPLQFQINNLQTVWINNFTLPKNFSAELIGFYQTKLLAGNAVSLPMGALNLGIQKQLKGNGGTLRFGVDDLFNSLKLRLQSSLPQDNLESSLTLDFSQRTFKLSYSRNFGNNQLKGTRQRSTGSEEERKRVN